MATDLLRLLAPVERALATLDLSEPEAATLQLRADFPTARMGPVTDALLDAYEAGTLTPREAGPGVRFGRIAKPAQTEHGFAIDAVALCGSGAAHTHTTGEVSWCIPLDGEPKFEGVSEGWVVLPPGSTHEPTVTGGTMLIAYFLPDGAMEWHAA